MQAKCIFNLSKTFSKNIDELLYEFDFVKNGKSLSFLLPALPGTFMTAVSVTYIMMTKEGLNLPSSIAYPVGIISAFAAFVWCCIFAYKHNSIKH